MSIVMRVRVLAVHPRVGGETQSNGVCPWKLLGPSPRGRGNLSTAPTSRNARGSIPAWAGKPRPAGQPRTESAVHPRVGGETNSRSAAVCSCCGPSPRGRGNRDPGDDGTSVDGSIPAWAGKPASCFARCWTPRVHPRVGGETCTTSGRRTSSFGPSPRGRGNHATVALSLIELRSIPAWAGKPAGVVVVRPQVEVHPRVGGETSASI